jgi:hypothetical protein
MEQLAQLGAIQHRLWCLITEPSGVEAALAAEGVADARDLARLVRGDRGLSPIDRLAVYANAYFARIHDCLRDDFGALARALGNAAFHDLVKTYLMKHPPTRPSLRHVGAHLAAHLSTEPFAGIFSRRCPYAADLARLEWAITEAFYAADSPLLGREELTAVAPDDWGSLRFEPVPSFQILTCAWPVHTLRDRFEAEDTEAVWDEAPPLVAEATFVRVWRSAERARYRVIPRLEFEVLGAVMADEPFAEICDRVAREAGGVDAAAHAATLLASWVSEGVLARLHSTEGTTS